MIMQKKKKIKNSIRFLDIKDIRQVKWNPKELFPKKLKDSVTEFKSTKQQLKIEKNVVNLVSISVIANAGVGKTITSIKALDALVKAHKEREVLALYFNAAGASETREKSDKFEAKTWNSKAFQHMRQTEEFNYTPSKHNNHNLLDSMNLIVPLVIDPEGTYKWKMFTEDCMVFDDFIKEITTFYLENYVNTGSFLDENEIYLLVKHVLRRFPLAKYSFNTYDDESKDIILSALTNILHQIKTNLREILRSKRPYRKLYKKGGLTFSMMLNVALQDKAFLTEYDTILVDEFQDSSMVCTKKLTQLHELGKQIIVVGDTKQQLYSFRGVSDPFNEIPKMKQLPLTISFRNTKEVVKNSTKYVSDFIPDKLLEKYEGSTYTSVVEGDESISVIAPLNKILILMAIEIIELGYTVSINQHWFLSTPIKALIKFKKLEEFIKYDFTSAKDITKFPLTRTNYLRSNKLLSLRELQSLLIKHSPEKLLSIITSISPNPDFRLLTVHGAKGRTLNRVMYTLEGVDKPSTLFARGIPQSACEGYVASTRSCQYTIAFQTSYLKSGKAKPF